MYIFKIKSESIDGKELHLDECICSFDISKFIKKGSLIKGSFSIPSSRKVKNIKRM